MPLRFTLLRRCALMFFFAAPALAYAATLTGGFAPLIPGTNMNLTAVGPVERKRI
jgi:hypothetical protein